MTGRGLYSWFGVWVCPRCWYYKFTLEPFKFVVLIVNLFNYFDSTQRKYIDLPHQYTAIFMSRENLCYPNSCYRRSMDLLIDYLID